MHWEQKKLQLRGAKNGQCQKYHVKGGRYMVVRKWMSLLLVFVVLLLFSQGAYAYTDASGRIRIITQHQTKYKDLIMPGHDTVSIYEGGCGYFALIHAIQFLSNTKLTSDEEYNLVKKLIDLKLDTVYNSYSANAKGTVKGMSSCISAIVNADPTLVFHKGIMTKSYITPDNIKNIFDQGGVIITHIEGHYLCAVGYRTDSSGQLYIQMIDSSAHSTIKPGWNYNNLHDGYSYNDLSKITKSLGDTGAQYWIPWDCFAGKCNHDRKVINWWWLSGYSSVLLKDGQKPEYPFDTVDASIQFKAKQVKYTEGANLKDIPYADGNNMVHVAYNEELSIHGLYINKYNNYWCGVEKDGRLFYICANNIMRLDDDASKDVTINDNSYSPDGVVTDGNLFPTGTLKKGAGFNLRGTVRSPYTIKTAQGFVYNEKSLISFAPEAKSKLVDVNKKSFDILNSAVNVAKNGGISFGSLSEGGKVFMLEITYEKKAWHDITNEKENPLSDQPQRFTKRFFSSFSVGAAEDTHGDIYDFIDDIKATDITLNTTSVTMNRGEIHALNATIIPNNVTNPEIEWSSTDETVVIVANGTISAVGTGTATVIASTNDGSNKKATCLVTVEDPPCNHDSVTTYTVSDPTCTEPGTTETRCDNCNMVISTGSLLPLGHDFGPWNVITAATCTTEGIESRICYRVSNHTELRAIPATGHTLIAYPQIEATYTETGTEAYWKCEACGKLFSDAEATTEIDAPIIIGKKTGNPVSFISCGNRNVLVGENAPFYVDAYAADGSLASNQSYYFDPIDNELCTVTRDGIVYGKKKGLTSATVHSEENPDIFRTVPIFIHDPMEFTCNASVDDHGTVKMVFSSDAAADNYFDGYELVFSNLDAWFDVVSCDVTNKQINIIKYTSNGGQAVQLCGKDEANSISASQSATLNLLPQNIESLWGKTIQYTFTFGVLISFDNNLYTMTCDPFDVTITFPQKTVQEPINLPGDVNEDGVVDGRDSVRLMKYLAGETEDETGAIIQINKYNADVTGDGKLDERDLLRLVKYLGGEDVTLLDSLSVRIKKFILADEATRLFDSSLDLNVDGEINSKDYILARQSEFQDGD